MGHCTVLPVHFLQRGSSIGEGINDIATTGDCCQQWSTTITVCGMYISTTATEGRGGGLHLLLLPQNTTSTFYNTHTQKGADSTSCTHKHIFVNQRRRTLGIRDLATLTSRQTRSKHLCNVLTFLGPTVNINRNWSVVLFDNLDREKKLTFHSSS